MRDQIQESVEEWNSKTDGNSALCQGKENTD